MAEIEKVVKGLQHCFNAKCEGCPYGDTESGHYVCRRHEMLGDALELLKEQEALEPVEMIDDFYPIGDPLRTIGWKCGKCMERVAGYDNYCPNCGRELKWE